MRRCWPCWMQTARCSTPPSGSGHKRSICVRWSCGQEARRSWPGSCRRWKHGSCVKRVGMSAGMGKAVSAGMTCLRLRPTIWRLAWKGCSAWADAFAGEPAPTGIAPALKLVQYLWERVYPRRGPRISP
ncbi:protein of unknown function [Pseudomonas sp. JV551A1]|nr:protein of unknown function [Pseudomonas sp. JV551A1]